MANSVDPDQTAVCSGSTLFASPVMLGNFLQQTTSANDIFRCIFLGALRARIEWVNPSQDSISPQQVVSFNVPNYSTETWKHDNVMLEMLS